MTKDARRSNDEMAEGAASISTGKERRNAIRSFSSLNPAILVSKGPPVKFLFGVHPQGAPKQ